MTMRYSALALVAFCVTTACSKAPPPSNNASPQPAAAPSLTTGVAFDESIELTLGFKPALATERKLSELRADFNGDGVEDRLLVVRSASMPRSPPANVKVVRPWRLDEGERAGDLMHGASVNLVVFHGPGTAGVPQAVVLHDDNSISLLDAPAAAELAIIKQPDIQSLEEPSLTQAAKGDVLVVPTEAGIDTYVYWDGATYRVFAPIESP